MANPPILVPLIIGHSLTLYIIATPIALDALVAQPDDTGKKKAIYNISHTLVGYELNYTPLEKACLAIIFANNKLHHYM